MSGDRIDNYAREEICDIKERRAMGIGGGMFR